MGKIEPIKEQVVALEDEDLRAFALWFEEFQADQWDRQIEADAKSGKLDRLAEQALAQHRAGRTKPV